MKNKIEINFKKFFLNGEFEYIKLGATKEWIKNNFPEPDDIWNKNKFSIWRYNGIEFHFENEKLFLIFCDYLENIISNENINIDKWFLEDDNDLTTICVTKILLNEKVNFKVLNDKKLDTIKIIIEQSGVELHFETLDSDSENYYLTAFSLIKR